MDGFVSITSPEDCGCLDLSDPEVAVLRSDNNPPLYYINQSTLALSSSTGSMLQIQTIENQFLTLEEFKPQMRKFNKGISFMTKSGE